MFPNQRQLLFLQDTLCKWLICCYLHYIGLLGSFHNLSTDSELVQLGTDLQKLNSCFDDQQVLKIERAV